MGLHPTPVGRISPLSPKLLIGSGNKFDLAVSHRLSEVLKFFSVAAVFFNTDRTQLTDMRTFRLIIPAQPDQPSEAPGLWFDRASRFFPPGDSGGSYTNGMREFGLAHAKPPPQTGN